MPVMDGFSFCRHCKQDPQLKAIPFIFYTATYTDAKDEQFALEIGADLFIVKPQDPEALVQTIHGFIDKHRRGKLVPNDAIINDEASYLKIYNSALVRKLEDKVVQLDEANKTLAIKDFAISSAIAGIAMADLSGIVTYVNHSFAGIWGYGEDELSGKKLLSLFQDQNAFSAVIDALLINGQWTGELEAVQKGGMQFTVQISAHTVKSPKGAPICFMASCTDVTEHKRLQEELRRTQNLEALSLFSAGIAHDLNNLLTGLFNNLDLAREELHPDNPAYGSFTIAMSVFERAKDLAQRLLTFAKGGSAGRKPVRISNIIEESCSLSLSGSSIRYEFSANEKLKLVEANANQLSQVFTNILINARQAMNEKGALIISSANRRLKSGQVGNLPEGEYVAIRFEDDGPGIPDALLPKIFEPFFSTKQEGSGLGLAVSYSIVKDHGGHMQASSRPGGGAVFEIWLPAGKAAKPETAPVYDTNFDKGTGNILVMDDEEAIRNVAQTILSRSGYKTTCASHGQEALSCYRESLSTRPYDLVILDLTVRGGMGGIETLSEMLKLNPRVAAIASTGYSNSEDLPQLKKQGFIGILPKPYSRHEMLSVVKAATARM
jgi:PAS domain S-box-containing protein